MSRRKGRRRVQEESVVVVEGVQRQITKTRAEGRRAKWKETETDRRC